LYWILDGNWIENWVKFEVEFKISRRKVGNIFYGQTNTGKII
jgi:hypothetical protein